MEELGKITESKDVSLGTKAKIIHIFIFPITMHGCQVGQRRRLMGRQRIHLKYGVGGERYSYPGRQEDEYVGPRANEA